MNEPLNSTEIRSSGLKELFFWWEKRRVIYNLLIIGLTVFSVYSYWDYPMRNTIGSEEVIINAFSFILVANLLYTAGWVSEIYLRFLFKFKGFSTNIRWILFVLGTALSLIWTNFYFVIMFDVLFAD